MANVVEVTDETFEAEVIKAETPVLVDFWAPWCGPCKALGPVLSEIADERNAEIKVVKVNIDDNQEYAFKLGVMSIPTLVVFKDGQPIDKIVGAHPKTTIDARINKLAAVEA
ncbi:MAG TPA: thioredoxin [Thermomicrobiales bacterium]|nr:thioredoxin [Thermomicrobiales bacterium]